MLNDKTSLIKNSKSDKDLITAQQLQLALDGKNKEVSRLRMQFDDMCKRMTTEQLQSNQNQEQLI